MKTKEDKLVIKLIKSINRDNILKFNTERFLLKLSEKSTDSNDTDIHYYKFIMIDTEDSSHNTETRWFDFEEIEEELNHEFYRYILYYSGVQL